ncbi:MAG TPA: metal-dependent hydrolase [Cyclobacteriaceae bacterium]
MDSITHIVLGAVIGEAFAGKKLGKKAMLIGAAAQSLPDIDFVASFWLSPSQNLLAHRSITHSFLFAVLATVLFSILLNRWYRSKEIELSRWMIFLGLEIFVHLFLDASNTYGVGWFEPFSHERIAFNIIFVADPWFSIWSGIGVIALMILKIENPKRKYWTAIALIMSVVYFAFALNNKRIIDANVKENIVQQKIEYKRYFEAPTAINSLLWNIVIETDRGYQIGYRSIFDDTDKIEFNYITKDRSLLNPVDQFIGVDDLIKFSKGYYTVDRVDSTVIFNDLRFGQIRGWDSPKSPFVFRFYLQKPEENRLVMQRGRFSGWDKEGVQSLLKRIGGI